MSSRALRIHCCPLGQPSTPSCQTGACTAGSPAEAQVSACSSTSVAAAQDTDRRWRKPALRAPGHLPGEAHGSWAHGWAPRTQGRGMTSGTGSGQGDGTPATPPPLPVLPTGMTGQQQMTRQVPPNAWPFLTYLQSPLKSPRGVGWH